MTTTKSNRIFLGVVTILMALAGTGLTIANNGDFKNYDLQVWAIAITLAACFSTAEVTFLWGHKLFERVKGLARKIPLVIALTAVVASMGFAVYEELNLALKKLDNRGLAENSAVIVGSADRRNQRILGVKALSVLSSSDIKIKTNPIPFVVCYLITGLATIVLVIVSHTRAHRIIKGNQASSIPDLSSHFASIGANPETAKAYAVSGGYAIHDKTGYKGFVSQGKVDLSKKKIGF